LFSQEMWLIENITTENLWRDKWIVNEKTSYVLDMETCRGHILLHSAMAWRQLTFLFH
jgi:hypothetical protein